MKPNHVEKILRKDSCDLVFVLKLDKPKRTYDCNILLIVNFVFVLVCFIHFSTDFTFKSEICSFLLLHIFFYCLYVISWSEMVPSWMEGVLASTLRCTHRWMDT